MRVHLHIPPHHVGEKFFEEREVSIDLPLPPFPGLVIGVGIGDGTPEAPSQTGQVRVTTVTIEHNWVHQPGYWQMTPKPMPVEDSAMTEVHTEWVHRPGYRGHRG